MSDFIQGVIFGAIVVGLPIRFLVGEFTIYDASRGGWIMKWEKTKR